MVELAEDKDGDAVEKVSEILSKVSGEEIVIVKKDENGNIIKAQIDEDKIK